MDVVKQGVANLARGGIAVGGRLTLTATHLRFEPHELNLPSHGEPFEVALSDVRDVRPCWSRFLGVPLVPNGVEVDVGRDDPVRYVVARRQAWCDAIAAGAGLEKA